MIPFKPSDLLRQCLHHFFPQSKKIHNNEEASERSQILSISEVDYRHPTEENG
jgi:hypothetical protein